MTALDLRSLAGNRHMQRSVRPGEFRGIICGRLRARDQVETASDLNLWAPLVTLANSRGAARYNDPSITNSTPQFFQVEAP